MKYIRVRKVLGAPGKVHRYLVQPFVIDTETGKVTPHTQKEIPISETKVRMKESGSKWEIQKEGCGNSYFLLTPQDVVEFNNQQLSELIQANGGLT